MTRLGIHDFVSSAKLIERPIRKSEVTALITTLFQYKSDDNVGFFVYSINNTHYTYESWQCFLLISDVIKPVPIYFMKVNEELLLFSLSWFRE